MLSLDFLTPSGSHRACDSLAVVEDIETESSEQIRMKRLHAKIKLAYIKHGQKVGSQENLEGRRPLKSKPP